MKKSLKILAVVAFLFVILVSLTGCGNKIVATKETTEDGITYKEKVEIKLKDEKVDTIKMTMTFEDKDTAEKMKEKLDQRIAMLKMRGMDSSGIEIEGKGKKIIMNLDANAFATMGGVEITETSKDDIKKSLEEEGYKVK